MEKMDLFVTSPQLPPMDRQADHETQRQKKLILRTQQEHNLFILGLYPCDTGFSLLLLPRAWPLL